MLMNRDTATAGRRFNSATGAAVPDALASRLDKTDRVNNLACISVDQTLITSIKTAFRSLQ